MALPTKELDRLKPFKRINNDSFLVTEKPTDSAVDCGCHTDKDLPADADLVKEFKAYLERDGGAAGKLFSALDVVKTVTDAISSVINGLRTVTDSIPILRQIVSSLVSVIDIFNKVAQTIDDVLREFMERIGAELVKRAIRLIPQWVPVRKGESKTVIGPEQIVEVEGIVTRSYGNPVEAPFIQWHTWMNWSIQLQPEPQYENLVFADIAADADSDKVKGKGDPVAKPGSFDVQWDVGAMTEPQDVSAYVAGFDDTEMPDHDGPMTGLNNNWIWPTTGMYAWASGRWVFDCSRVDDVDAASPKTCAIMNPPRAIATAVWGAVEFDENPLRPNSQLRCSVPAIQFMFFACRRGGYIDYSNDQFSSTTFEFIVDLPPLDEVFPPFSIDFSPNIDHNKIVLRPRLLQKIEGLIGGDSIKIEPIVQVLPPENPGEAPKQALVTIPADSIPLDSKAVGFILSMGWHDPLRKRAATVKRCSILMKGVESFIKRDNSAREFEARFGDVLKDLRVKIRKRLEDIRVLGYSINSIPTHDTKPKPNVPDFVLDAGDEIHKGIDNAIDRALEEFQKRMIDLLGGLESDECLFRVCVNGRWRSVYFRNKNPEFQTFPGFALAFNLDLGPEDTLFIAMNGVEFNAVGGMMRSRIKKRTLQLRHADLSFGDICEAVKPDLTDIAYEYAMQTLLGNESRLLALGSENTAMGLIDPDGDPGTEVQTSNPLKVGDIDPLEQSIVRRANFAHAIVPEYGVYATSEQDYDLHYTLKIEDLIRKPQTVA